eukprot:TRINITY_DN10187_c0_g1_i1.p1 TRINITY_DN10187_c0_g1~~TRINITY_DN10187_c0_g1_i1.p1  ORF type:complete len:526 (-),score=105.75 TRINITY_DN10187_c0_g1_i1:273-1658(-)
MPGLVGTGGPTLKGSWNPSQIEDDLSPRSAAFYSKGFRAPSVEAPGMMPYVGDGPACASTIGGGLSGGYKGNRPQVIDLHAHSHGHGVMEENHVVPSTQKSKPLSMKERLGRSLQLNMNKEEESNRRGIQQTEEFEFLNRYKLGDEVMPSAHQFIAVRFATRRSDNKKFVVKLMLKPQCFKGAQDENSWRRSTNFMLNLPENQTEGIARLYEVLEDSETVYVVMEYVEGMDLFELLEENGAVPVDTAREIVKQLLEAVRQLHDAGAVHKDLKLENVMVSPAMSPLLGNSPIASPRGSSHGSGSGTPRQAVKLIDFDTVEEWTPKSPKASVVLGTNQYIAQEAYDGNYSPASDIFAVGVIAYRTLTGDFPYNDDMFDDKAGENWVGSPKMAEIRNKLRAARVNFDGRIFQANPAARELVESMLSYKEHHRPSAGDALKHRWFTEAGAAAPAVPAKSARFWSL